MIQYEKDASSHCWLEEERGSQRNEGSLHKQEKVRTPAYPETYKKEDNPANPLF